MAAGFDKYIKASNKRPAKRMSDGRAIIATSTVHGPGQMRCLKCHGMCGSATMPDGRSVLRCSSCGNVYSPKNV